MLRKHNSARVAQLNALKKAADVMASITSLGVGSGLDLNGLLGQLEQAETQKLVPIQTQLETQQVQISAYGEIQSALSAFNETASALSNPDLFESVTSNVTGNSIEAAAGADARPGSYEVNVSEIATAGSLATERMADLETAVTDQEGQELELRFENAELNHEVAIDAGSTLAEVRDAINADPQATVNASIVFDGAGHRLALMSAETGEEASILSTNFSDLAEGNLSANPGEVVSQEGQNADLTVNGIDITSASNQIEGAIQGVALDLQEPGTSTVSIERDNETIRDGITGFVDAYNEFKQTTDRLTAFNGEEGAAGELIGDNTVRTIEAQLRNDLATGVVQEGETSLLSDVGLSLNVDGTLSLDEQALDAAMAENPSAVAGFFAGTAEQEGLAGRLETTSSQLLDNDGALQSAVNSSEARVTSLEDRFARTEVTISNTIERYRSQFVQLDSMVAQMNQTSDYLTQQLSGLGGGSQQGGML